MVSSSSMSRQSEDTVKACPHWIWIQTGSVTKLPNANSMQIQCASIVSTLHCAEPNSRVDVDFKWPHLHTVTMAPLSDLYFSQPSYCFSSWADTWKPEAHSLLVCDTSVHAMPFLVSRATRNCAIQINLDWANAHSVWTRSNRIRSSSMCIGCPVWTGL